MTAHAMSARGIVAPRWRILVAGIVLFPAILYPLHALLLLGMAALLWPGPVRTQLADLVTRAGRPMTGGTWLTQGLAVALALVVVGASGLPSTDGLRHLVAHELRYDWLTHYGDARHFTHWSWWIGHEWLMGLLHRGLGGDTAMTARLAQIAMSSMVLLGLAQAFRRAVPGRPGLQCVLLVLACLVIAPRLAGARPEAWMLLVVPAAMWMSRSAWLAMALLLAPAYWFSPVYAVAALLFPLRKRGDLLRNLCVGAVYALAAAAFWVAYSGGEYLRIPELLGAALREHGELEVTELMPLAVTVVSWQMVPVLAVFGMAVLAAVREGSAVSWAARRSALQACAVGLFFALPDYARYVNVLGVLLLLAAAHLLGEGGAAVTRRALAVVAVAWVATLPLIGVPGPSDAMFERAVYRVAPGARVLAPFSEDAYLATATNPGATVTPMFDPGMIEEGARALVVTLSQGRFPPCEAVRGRYDYIAESRTSGEPPWCLELVRYHGKNRLWRVR